MTLEKIRQKTQELHAKTRRALLGSMAQPLVVAAISGWGIKWFDGPMVRAAFAIAIIWSAAGQYFGNRGMWSAAPADAALSNGIASYRREVERWRHLSERFLLWYFGPMVLAIATLIAPLLSLGIRRGMLLSMSPFVTLIVIWIAAVFVIRMRQHRKLQREIDELNEIERANR